MKSGRIAAWGTLLAGLSVACPAQTYIWTGLEPTFWQGGVTLPANSSATVILPDVINRTVTLPGDISVAALVMSSGDNYTFVPSFAASLPVTLSAAAISADTGRLQFDSNINLDNLLLLNVASGGVIVIPGQITGVLSGFALQSDGTGGFIFNNPEAGNTYSGTTAINGQPGLATTVAFWNSSPFGTSAVTATNSTQLVAHGTQNLSNAFTFATTTPNDPIILKSWDAPLTFSGPVTLATGTTFNAQITPSYVPSADGAGVYASPGPNSRNPIIFSGSITQSGGAQALTVTGPGVVMLTGSGNTYSGGTTVDGSLVFTPSAIPSGGGTITEGAGGYVGIAPAAVGTFNISDLTSLLTSFNLNAPGSIGIDTLPGNATTVVSAPISLAGFTNPTISLGTATSAILQGTITPQGNNYQFGDGGGTLTVQSNLADLNPPSQLLVNSTTANPPLTLYLQGGNTYTGATTVTNSFLIFDGTGALPAYTQLTAAGSPTNVGTSYIGYTDAVGGLNNALFLAQFNRTNTYGIIGFDTHPGNDTVTISDPIDLTGFNDGVFIGTTTDVFLTGALTPSTVTNGSNAPNTLRFTAGLGSSLIVNSTLADLNGGSTPLSVMLGTPSALTPAQQSYSDGTVVINPTTANTYTGGTILNTNGPLTLAINGTSPLGTGPLTIVPDGQAPVGLLFESGFTLPNNIVLQPPTGSQIPATLYLASAYGYVLSGNLSGYGDVVVDGDSEQTVTLTGNNSGYGGDFDVFVGRLMLASNTAAGTGTLFFDGPNAEVDLTSLAPTLYGLRGDVGRLVLSDGATLTVDPTNSDSSAEFGGTITGDGGGPTTAALVVTASAPTPVLLYGANTYSGGTTILGHAVVGMGDPQALGSGMVTVNAPGGGLAINTGITFTNPLTFTAGGLGGFGTFAPSNLTNITFGPGQQLVPGFPSLSSQPAGTLTFQTDVTFANGGTYAWSLQDATRADGFSQVIVNGNFNITATGGGFLLELGTFDAAGNLGIAAVFDPNSPASWMIAQTTGTLTGFSPGAFTIDTSDFEGGVLPSSDFSLSLDGTNQEILLNFTPVPEPSTWALFAGGTGMLGLVARRRRRRA